MVQFFDVISKLFDDYRATTSSRLKIFVYCVLVGTFPFNSFLSGFISTVGSFVLASCLRIQINPENKSQFPSVSPERAFADFIFASCILHLVVVNFLAQTTVKVMALYLKPISFVKRAIINPKYYPSYAAYGGSAFLMAIYFCEWKTVGQYIPLWSARYPKDE
ncbi:hypothetical protein QR680_008076 [Steinernema hermaphroditum]|uniref:Dolichyl-diphosphooligosaccharide--protein glycosyltransferase subunit DAD1 n=1 Tax=Steinernema hermaphroditum TaxID=289476 RepID=A0AA39M779_9BILA|nr:hypothetical protein QR680_008076 [Steinernema hermaphroditum]